MTFRPVAPSEISIEGIRPLARPFRSDRRGFLIETLRSDDAPVNGARFQMTYSSLTVPGEYRDADRWHVHQVQTDRFVVVLGEMILALLDDRPNSKTRGTLNVVRMSGSSAMAPDPSSKDPSETFLVPIPPGVLHCIGNLSKAPFLLQNFPTELYNPSDEGRIPFVERRIASHGVPFSWGEVEPEA